VISLIEDRAEEVRQICHRHGVERLDLFGSAAGEGFDDLGDSDLDFVVTFERRNPPELFDRYFGLKEDLEALFGRGVDLVMEGAVRRNPYFAQSVAEARVPLCMRPERTPKTLEDIRDAAAFVLAATEGKTLDDFSEDRLLR
jgi:predicted nucleotidyltransferase